jgi:hypothetical protein
MLLFKRFLFRGHHLHIYIYPHIFFIINTHIDNNGAVSALPGYEEGLWWVQDVSSRLAGLVLIQSLREANTTKTNTTDTDTMSEKVGLNEVGVDRSLSKLHVVDMCAAPGGKTAQLIDAGIGEVCLFSECVVVCS